MTCFRKHWSLPTFCTWKPLLQLEQAQVEQARGARPLILIFEGEVSDQISNQTSENQKSESDFQRPILKHATLRVQNQSMERTKTEEKKGILKHLPTQ